MIDSRLAALPPLMRAADLDAAALIPGPNFRRLFGIGFPLMERPLVLLARADGATAAVVPALEAARFERLGLDTPIFRWTDNAGYAAAFAAAAAALGPVKRLGVEAQRMRVFESMALTAAMPGATIVDAQAALASIRLRKTDTEIAKMREAIRRSEAALHTTLAQVEIGQTEIEIRSILIRELFAAGVEGLAFPPIVAAGANACDPHAESRADYRLRDGDALLLDFGGVVEGYNADITRTVFAGHVADEDRALYDTVLAANEAGRAAARPGLSAGALDDSVQRLLEASAFSDFIVHKTGHGLGLEVHEEPYIMRGVETSLEPGMLFTVEPGLYRPGRLGVRIEDDVVVAENGAESLTQFPRDLRIVG